MNRRSIGSARIATWLLLTALCGWLAAPTPARAVPGQIYYFTGDCTDCTGQGQGVLTLVDYVLGENLIAGNFVSFSYTSNLISFSYTASDLQYISGALPATLPSTSAGVDIAWFDGVNHAEIYTSSGGTYWCVDMGGCADYGPSYVWSATAPAVPEPASLALLGGALVAFGVARRRA